VPTAMRKAFQEANASINERGKQNPEFHGMGTTSTALVLRADGAWVGHVGDSRAYRVRNFSVQQLSFDHSLLWEKARRRHVRPEDIQGVPHNVIVRSLGPEAEVDVDVQGPHPVLDGDVFVVCSDGLSGPLTDREIGAVASVLPPPEATRFLIDLANLRGGPDNITLIIVRVGKAKKKAKAEDDDDAPRKPKRPGLLRRVPWPLWILLAGLLLAGGAVGLVVNKLPGGQSLFMLAAATILAGLVGLGIYYLLDKKRREEQPEFRPRTKIYRESACVIDPDLVSKLTKAEETLANRARDQEWDVDWKTHDKHLQQAQQHLASGNLNLAFRDYCRAAQPLTDALSKHRHKEEAFNPNWEKTEDSA